MTQFQTTRGPKIQHDHPDKMIQALSRMVHNGATVANAAEILKS